MIYALYDMLYYELLGSDRKVNRAWTGRLTKLGRKVIRVGPEGLPELWSRKV